MVAVPNDNESGHPDFPLLEELEDELLGSGVQSIIGQPGHLFCNISIAPFLQPLGGVWQKGTIQVIPLDELEEELFEQNPLLILP